MTRKPNPPAASGERASSPKAADSPGDGHDEHDQDADRGQPVQRPGAGPEADRERHREDQHGRGDLRTTLAATCPARIDAPATSRDRNRSMIPPVRSVVTPTAVVAAPNPALNSTTPGTT